MPHRVEWDRSALQTFALANLLLLLSAGLLLVVQLIRVLIIGSGRPALPDRCAWIIVPGHSREGIALSADFKTRLDRAARLANQFPEARLLLLGGITDPAQRSEAAAGAEFLHRQHHIPAWRIVQEEDSRHTLENFQRARELIRPYPGQQRCLIVTNRYHLARASAMARNLGLPVTPCPAAPHWGRQDTAPGKLLAEAYLLHWYETGALYARLTRNRAMLDRVRRSEPVDE
ncbi:MULTISPECIES: YdcF family protein [unclassified Halorhodospira]|uniref:YdcF family protein n=1 Tax=unclassified Halorhodospira TaxID=2626748 RepID=UPI001EE7CECD|nr:MULTISPECIES: YdcF family protein [unclassified Halorhodospira]MCG5537195.1 YdcF family protein [Halorhodospira sp. 9622]MCG5540241.1 YdcF family protein [Halorhodospira sp. M39old]MCG5545058.1 YdcF family protein [Halorhodospira sp. M38]